jgi:hypothetical protein
VNEARAAVVPALETELREPELLDAPVVEVGLIDAGLVEVGLVELGLAPAVLVDPPPQALTRAAVAASGNRSANTRLLARRLEGSLFLTLTNVAPPA